MNKGLLILILAVIAGLAFWLLRPADESMQAETNEVVTAGPGVDVERKVVRVGTLNDESGPAAGIGKPYAIGKRLLAAKVNQGDSGILPEGWKIVLIERDHGYNPQTSVQAYNEIKDEVLFIGTSFGTPNTLPLRPMLERDEMVAYPASLSSKMAEHPNTPPLGTPYVAEAMRAMDWAVEHAGGADKVKAGIVYQQDDYGADGIEGWRKSAAHHGVEIVSEQSHAPGQSDYTAVVTELKKAGANYILLTTLPSATGPILGTAAQLQFMPIWIGNTPAWIDRFFSPEVIPAAVFTNFYWSTGLPYWGEKEIAGMKDFLAAYDQFGKAMGNPDFYILASYAQGVVQLEALGEAIEAGDLSRQGYMKAMRSLTKATGAGLVQPVDLSRFPYQTGNSARILKPKMAEGTWDVVSGFADPKVVSASAGPAADGEAEGAPTGATE